MQFRSGKQVGVLGGKGYVSVAGELENDRSSFPHLGHISSQ